jgi:predicted ATP-grasp superfamily ATP-dependent carboligase
MAGSAGQPQPLVVGVASTLTGFVARGLARAGMRPVVLGWHRPLPVGLLPGCRRHVAWEGVRWEGGELALDAARHVDETCRALGLDVVVAADHDAVLLLGRAPPPRTARVAPVPAPEAVRSLHDKWRLSGLLRELGLPGPESELARSPADLEGTRLPFPLTTKPLDRWGGLGFQVHAAPADLRRAIARGLDAPFPLLVQPFVPGVDVGFSFLARRGRLLACSMFLHVRDGERRFFDDPVLRRHGERLLEATGYDGVGHVDARRDPSGGYHLLELNPRFWASLPYAVEAGVNYPDLLVRADEVAAGPVRTARPGPVSLGLGERSLSLAVRWWERACVAARRLGERHPAAARASGPGPR